MIIRWGAGKNRYGLPRDLIKKKYLECGVWSLLLTQVSIAHRIAQTPCEIHDISAIMRDALQ
jgi:hypothetical protein